MDIGRLKAHLKALREGREVGVPRYISNNGCPCKFGPCMCDMVTTRAKGDIPNCIPAGQTKTLLQQEGVPEQDTSELYCGYVEAYLNDTLKYGQEGFKSKSGKMLLKEGGYRTIPKIMTFKSI
jgi:hypothetical protein